MLTDRPLEAHWRLTGSSLEAHWLLQFCSPRRGSRCQTDGAGETERGRIQGLGRRASGQEETEVDGRWNPTVTRLRVWRICRVKCDGEPENTSRRPTRGRYSAGLPGRKTTFPTTSSSQIWILLFSNLLLLWKK